MTEEIIIDGVNVAGCEHRSDTHNTLLADGKIMKFEDYCHITNDGCYGVNCYYKQLKRLEQENKELQAYKDVNEDFKKAWDELNEKHKQLRSALEEIRILATKNVSIENFVKIQNKINEVLQ